MKNKISFILILCIFGVGSIFLFTNIKKEMNENEINQDEMNENDLSHNDTSKNDSNKVPDLTPSKDMQDLADELNKAAGIDLRVPFYNKIVKEYSKNDIGILSENFDALIEDGIKNESQMRPSNHSLCIIKVKEGNDISKVSKEIFENCNPNKWICTSAEKVVVASSDNYIMLVMSDEEKCIQLYKAFEDKFKSNDKVNKLEKDVLEKYD